VYLNYDDEWNPARVSLQGTRSPEEEEMRWLLLLSVSAIQQGVRKYTVASVGSDERTGRTASAVISGQDRFLSKPNPIALSISDAFDYRTLADRLIASVQIASSDWIVALVDSGYALGAKAVLLLDQHSKVSPEELFRKWGCGLETAKRTLKVTTQKVIGYAVQPVHRRYRVDHLNLHRKRLNQEWYMDQMFSRTTSMSKNTCANVFTNGKVTKVYPLPSTSSANLTNSLQDSADDVDIPSLIHLDLAAAVEGRH
jgi:hypothetical protein